MPADHINIQHPDKRGVETNYYRDRLEIEKLKVELSQLRMWYDAVAKDLESVFNRIEGGKSAELHYPDGRVFIVTGTPRSS